MGWLSNRLPARVRVWLLTTCQACRGLAVAWLRGANVRDGPGSRHARYGHCRRGQAAQEGIAMVAVVIGVDPHKGSHTAAALSAAEEAG